MPLRFASHGREAQSRREKIAGLLLLDGDPAESIRNTRRVSAVYLRGVAVARERYPID